MKASNPGSGKGLEKQTSIPGLQSCNMLMESALLANFGMPSRSARWQTILKFNDIWCGSSCTRLTWEGYFGIIVPHFSGIEIGNFVFAMLWLGIAPDNAATDPMDLKLRYSIKCVEITQFAFTLTGIKNFNKFVVAVMQLFVLVCFQ